MDVPTFISKFHNLDGQTLGEKQKNINTLLKDAPSDHTELVAALTPQNPIEHLLRLQILLKLQRMPELLEVLKSEDACLPAKLLKSKWFCQQLASTLDKNSSGFVEGTLPYLSFVIRKRLLTKIAVFGTKLDQVFDDTCAVYGFDFGLNVLVGCSAAKIETLIKEYNVVLSPDHLKVLARKNLHLFALYGKRDEFRGVDDSCMKYVAENDIHFFMELVKGCTNIGRIFGKRTTKKIVTLYKDFVIANTERWNHCLRMKTVFNCLTKEDLIEYVFNYCPSRVTPMFGQGPGVEIRNLIDNLGPKYYEIIKIIAQKKYNKSVYEMHELVTLELMETMDIEERQKWIEIKRKSGVEEHALIPLFKTADAIPLIKMKINVASFVGSREEFMELLVKTCVINKDLDALEEVGKYVCSRHRNDQESVLSSFIQTVLDEVKMEELEPRHWKVIDEVMKNVERQSEPFYKYKFSVEKVKFLYRHKLLTDEEICTFLKVAVDDYRWEFEIGDKHLERIFLVKSIDLIPTLYEEDSEKGGLKLLNIILEWNKKSHIPISVHDYPTLIEAFKNGMKKAAEPEEHSEYLPKLTDIFAHFICSKHDSDLRDSAIEGYFSVNSSYYDVTIDYWLLKHQPQVILTFFDKFLDRFFSKLSTFLTLKNAVQRYTSLEFQQRVITRSLELIAQKENLGIAFATLAALEPPQAYLDHIAPFYPSSDKSDDNTAIKVAESFKHATSHVVLPTLLTYCKGDFLRYALEGLYYLFLHVPGNKLSVFLKEISTKAVSVRKHALFLTCNVGTVADMRHLVKMFSENERNVSMLKHTFNATLRYFIKNQLEEFWEYLKICMKKLDKNDSESFRAMVNVRKIPEAYQARHVVFVWDILKNGEDIESNRMRLLSLLESQVYKDFSPGFILTVIEEYFLKNRDVNKFVIMCLSHSSHREKVMTAVFQTIQKYDFSDLYKEKIVVELVFAFIDSLVNTLGTDVENFIILRQFSNQWSSVFSHTQALREYLKLSLTVAYLESDKDLGKFSVKVTHFLDEIVGNYGLALVEVFAEETRNLLRNFLCAYGEFSSNFYNFCYEILQKSGLEYQLFVLKMLPSREPERDSPEFLRVFKVLRESPEEATQALMNIYVISCLG